MEKMKLEEIRRIDILLNKTASIEGIEAGDSLTKDLQSVVDYEIDKLREDYRQVKGDFDYSNCVEWEENEEAVSITLFGGEEGYTPEELEVVFNTLMEEVIGHGIEYSMIIQSDNYMIVHQSGKEI